MSLSEGRLSHLSQVLMKTVVEGKLGTVRSRIHRGRAQLRAALAHRSPVQRATAASEPADEGELVDPSGVVNAATPDPVMEQ